MKHHIRVCSTRLAGALVGTLVLAGAAGIAHAGDACKGVKLRIAGKRAKAIAVSSVGGVVTGFAAAFGRSDLAHLRYLTDGKVDMTLGRGGKVLAPASG